MHISSIGASIFSDLAVHNHTTSLTGLDTAGEFDPLFATETDTPAAGTFTRVKNVREFPSMGTPANIVNVPGYGSKTSQQVQGQADAPNMELTINYVAADWSSTSVLGAMVGDGKQHAFRFTLLNAKPPGYASTAASIGGAGTVENTMWYFIGKIDALLVNPQLTDATTATLTITLNSQFYGAYTL
jgi:hypothetical protein